MAKGKYPQKANWVDKELQKHKIRKMVEEAMNTPEFKEMQRQNEEKAVLNALGRFTFMMCEYLETRHGYKANGLKKFLKFVLGCLDYTGDNELYFKDCHDYFLEEYGVDVLGELGLGIAKEGEENGKG